MDRQLNTFGNVDDAAEEERRKITRLRPLIAEAKKALPLPQLIRLTRDWNLQVELNLCPFHDDAKPSFLDAGCGLPRTQ